MAKQSLLSIVLRVKAKGFDASLMRAGKSLQKFGLKASAAGKTLTMALTAPLLAITAIAGKSAVDFEFAMAKVAAVGGFTAQEMGKLEAQAKALGASTSKSASEVAGLQLELSKLGKSQGEIESMTEGILSLGIAFDEDLGTVAAEVGATLNRFGLDASATNGVVDVLAKAFGSSALDLEKFGAAMGKAGPTANALGISLEDTTAAIGILTNNGIEASTAGTALTKAMTTLAKKGVPAEEILKTLFTGSLSVAEGFELFGDRAGKVIPVLQQNGQEWDALSEKLYNAEGAAGAARAVLEDTTKGALDKMKSALEAAALSLSEILLPAITKAANFVAGLASKFASLSSETKKSIVKWGAYAAAAGPALMLIGKFSSGIGMLLRIIPLLTGPIGILVAVIAGAIFAIIKNWDVVVAYFAEGAGATWLDTVIEYAESMINGIIFIFNAGLDMVMAFWDAWGSTIIDIVVEMANSAMKMFGFLFDTIGGLFNTFKYAFEGDWSKMFKSIGNTLISAVQFIIATLFAAFKRIGGLVDGILEKFGVSSGIVESMKSAEDAALSWLGSMKFEIDEVEKGAVSLGTVLDGLSSTWTSLSGGSGGGGSVSAPDGTGGQGVGGDGGGGLGGAEDQENLEGYNALLEETKTLGQQAGESVGQAFANLGDGIAGAIIQGEDFGTAMKAIFKNLLKQLLGLAISYAITSALSPLAPENLATAGSAGAAKAAAAPGFIASLFASLPAFAMGGAVTGPTLAMIGERPGSRGEFVVPFERLGQFMDMADGGGSKNQLVSGRISSGDIFLSNETSDRLVSRRRVVA